MELVADVLNVTVNCLPLLAVEVQAEQEQLVAEQAVVRHARPIESRSACDGGVGEDSMIHVVVSSNLLFDLFHFHVNQRVSEVVQVNTAKVVGQRLF